jgi:hypothetical protein
MFFCVKKYSISLISTDDVSEIVTMKPFIQHISYFPTDKRAEVCIQVLSLSLECDEKEKLRDPIGVHSLLQIAKQVNESLAIGQDVKKYYCCG